MENAQPPRLFRKNENKVALSEVEEKLKVMRQKRLSRLSTFIDEQNKLFEERSTKSDVMEEAILSIQQSAPEKVKFSIKSIAEDKSEDSTQEEVANVGEKKKVVRSRKLFERFSCVGQGFDDDDDEEEDEEMLRRDAKAQGIVTGTLTLHRKSKEYKKENQSTSLADSRVIDQDCPRVEEKSGEIANRSDGKFTYGAWTAPKKSRELGKDETTHQQKIRNDESPQLLSKDREKLEKTVLLDKIAYGNLLPKKTSNEIHDKSTGTKEYENVERHRSPAEKSSSFNSSDRVTKNFSALDSTASQSSENLYPSYVTLTFPRKTKPTNIQDSKGDTVQEDRNDKANKIVNKSRKDPPSEPVVDTMGGASKESAYEVVAVIENKMVLNTDEVQEKLDSGTRANESMENSNQKEAQHVMSDKAESLESTECLRSNETDEIKLALKRKSEGDISKCSILNPKSPVPTPRKVGVEYNTVLDFQTNMLHLTRNGDMDEDDIDQFNACYKKMSKLLEDYKKKMMEVERKKLPQRRLSHLKESISVVDQRIKRYRGLKRDAEYLEIKNLLSGMFSEISRMNVDFFEKKEEKDDLLKMVDRYVKKLVKKAVKNEDAMTELFREQIDLITAKRVVDMLIMGCAISLKKNPPMVMPVIVVTDIEDRDTKIYVPSTSDQSIYTKRRKQMKYKMRKQYEHVEELNLFV